MYLVFGVISVVVIVVVVLLAVFLMKRSTTTAEPAMESTSAGSKCINPCMGAGKVCQPDSKKDADGCFVQDCHCYSPNAAHTCSNPCNATGQVCHFNSPMDEYGCYMPSCRCITCRPECPMDKKCDPNTPSELDGCPMSGCTCVPSMCPARCPSGRQCAPDAPTDVNGCFDIDCMCVPVSRATTPPWTPPSVVTPKRCPVLCPANFSCHKMQPVDGSGCFVAPCPCIRDSCENLCPSDEICELNTPIDTDGCPMSGCLCVHEKGYVPPLVTEKTTESSNITSSVEPDSMLTTDPFITSYADEGEANGTDDKGSEARVAQDPGDNATVPHSPAGLDGTPDTLSKSSEADAVQQSSTAQGEISTPSASGDSTRRVRKEQRSWTTRLLVNRLAQLNCPRWRLKAPLGGEESGPRVRRSINVADFPVWEPPLISLSKALVKGASAAFNATRVLTQAHRGGVFHPDDTNAKYAPNLDTIPECIGFR
ncbi:hypothetical protein MTO96_017804 [Rhipicephalus appendiculatus]